MSDRTPKRPRDPNQLAKFIVDLATGEADIRNRESAGSPQSKGGTKRALALTSTERTEIARAGAKARWNKRQAKSDA